MKKEDKKEQIKEEYKLPDKAIVRSFEKHEAKKIKMARHMKKGLKYHA